MTNHKFIIICPECGAAVITASPSATIWELCPYCRHHVIDGYDVMMADACTDGILDGRVSYKKQSM
jgi:DNA-directed RNA polymerase subunit RPC12/RpoP